MDKLSFDTLRMVLLSVEPQIYQDTFRLATVSRALRKSALAVPFIWSSFSITKFTAQMSEEILPILLERSGTSVLKIDITPYPRNEGEERKVAQLLAANADRIQALSLNRTYLGWDSLVSSNLVFPKLKKIYVEFSPTTLSLRTPNLVSLDVNPLCENLDDIVGPSLEVLRIRNVTDSLGLPRLIQRTAHLKELVCVSETAMAPITTLPTSFALQNIEFLHLQLPGSEQFCLQFVQALNALHIVPNTIRVGFRDRDMVMPELHDIAREMMVGVGSRLFFDMHISSFTLADDSGLKRQFDIWDAGMNTDDWFPRFVLETLQIDGLRQIRIRASDWNILADFVTLDWLELDELRIHGMKGDFSIRMVDSEDEDGDDDNSDNSDGGNDDGDGDDDGDNDDYRDCEAEFDKRPVALEKPVSRVVFDIEPDYPKVHVEPAKAADAARIILGLLSIPNTAEVCFGSTRLSSEEAEHKKRLQELCADVSRLSAKPDSFVGCQHCVNI